MRPFIGNKGEMGRSKRHFDTQLDRLLAGDPDPVIGEGVADLVHRLHSRPADHRADTTLVAALAEEAAQSERAAEGVAAPLPSRWRRRITVSTFLSSLLGKMAIGAVALATTTGGLAATGNLPDPIQDWTSDQLQFIGLEIPDSEREDAGVLGVIEDGEPESGTRFGGDVADEASDGDSSDGTDKAETSDEPADDHEETEPSDDTTVDHPYRP